MSEKLCCFLEFNLRKRFRYFLMKIFSLFVNLRDVVD